MDSMALSPAQQFEIEKMNRIIDSTADIAALRKVAKELLTAWMMQRSATVWMMRQTLPKSEIPNG